MKKQPFCNFSLAGVSLTEFGLMIPAPFTQLQVDNSQIDSYTSWTLSVTVGGSANKKANIAAFEALLYSAAQKSAGYSNSSGIPVSFIFGWLNPDGTVAENVSYQGWTLKFNVSTSGRFMVYKLNGYASLAMQMSTPVLNIPAVSGIVQPSAIVEALAKAVKADTYYNLDIDHSDAPTYVNHGALTTSFTNYVRGSFKAQDDYDDFPGLLRLSTSYNATRDAAGLTGINKLSQGLNNLSVTPISNFLKKGMADNTVQNSSFSYWVDEPTMTQLGTIHYKSNAGLSAAHNGDTLEYGTANTNILSINGTYNGIAYNITDMSFAGVGFNIDGSGNTIVSDTTVVNSWSSTLADTFQSSSIINDINAIATQFSGDFQVQIIGTSTNYKLAQPVSLIILSDNTLSPISGIYNVMSVSHTIANTFVTTLKLQRLTMSSANQTYASQGISISNGGNVGYTPSSMTTTSNIISTGKVDFGQIYPDFETLVGNSTSISL